VGTEEHCETKKGFFIGYAVHKLLMCRLGRAEEDDRDHFGKKRLDLAGPLLGGLFRVLFRKLTKDVRKHLQRCLDEGKHFNIGAAIKSNHITDGLKYSLATGNWGDKGASTKAGVSQVRGSSNVSTLSLLSTTVGHSPRRSFSRAGAEPAHVRFVAVSLATMQHAVGPHRQASQASAVAFDPLRHGLSGRYDSICSRALGVIY
jgi:DNA-directed RNA polymerase II subunit RPB2